MPIFLERFVLPVCATLMIGVILLNPMKMDLQQRVSLGIGVLAIAYFVGHSLQRNKLLEQAKPPIVQPTPPTTGNATTTGNQSPAVTGNGNGVVYEAPPAPPKQEKP
jgi:hypothetical protein